jgi:hypothetical protein
MLPYIGKRRKTMRTDYVNSILNQYTQKKYSI